MKHLGNSFNKYCCLDQNNTQMDRNPPNEDLLITIKACSSAPWSRSRTSIYSERCRTASTQLLLPSAKSFMYTSNEKHTYKNLDLFYVGFLSKWNHPDGTTGWISPMGYPYWIPGDCVTLLTPNAISPVLAQIGITNLPSESTRS